MEIKIDREQCIGCETCCSVCSEFFEMGEDNKSHVKKEKQNDLEDVGCAKQAAESCPVQCIKIE